MTYPNYAPYGRPVGEQPIVRAPDDEQAPATFPSQRRAADDESSLASPWALPPQDDALAPSSDDESSDDESLEDAEATAARDDEDGVEDDESDSDEAAEYSAVDDETAPEVSTAEETLAEEDATPAEIARAEAALARADEAPATDATSTDATSTDEPEAVTTSTDEPEAVPAESDEPEAVPAESDSVMDQRDLDVESAVTADHGVGIDESATDTGVTDDETAGDATAGDATAGDDETAAWAPATVIAVSEPARPGEVVETRIAIWGADETAGFRDRLGAAAAQFVDDPSASVTAAAAVVSDAVEALAGTLQRQHDSLDPRQATENPDTEALRVAIRAYRDFLERVLAL